MNIRRGQWGEQIACEYLQGLGLSLVEKNYRSPCGEIDLIMKDGGALVFVEVRLRQSNSHGGALASITAAKQRKLLKTGQHYLVSKKMYDKIACRFDVISIQGTDKPCIDWISNAIEFSDY